MEFLLLSGVVPLALAYVYYVVCKLPPGISRVGAAIPVIGMYTTLPWQFSTIQMRSFTVVSLLWLGSFKLLMLCYDAGPLATPWSRSNLLNFITVATFPVNFRIPTTRSGTEKSTASLTAAKFMKLGGELGLVVLVINLYSFKNQWPRPVVSVVFSAYLYLILDVSLTSLAAIARCSIGVDLEPQFQKPYLSSLLTEFWGRRWNLTVTNTLRQSVYEPVLLLLWNPERGASVKPPLWARAVALQASFFVSEIMHEVIFNVLIGNKFCGQVTAFFVLHGFCSAAEAGLRRWRGGYLRAPHVIRVGSTLLFLYASGYWLFFPPIIDSGFDAKVMAEHKEFYHYLSNLIAK